MLQTACSRKAGPERTSQDGQNSKWTWGIIWGWMGHTKWDSVLLSAPSPVSVLVCSCYEFSSVLSHQREIRVNSPFTFVYEETPLHCQLRPPPLLMTHPRSGRKQGQKGCHIWGSSNMADPWSSRTKSLQNSARIYRLQESRPENSLCQEHWLRHCPPGGCFRQTHGCYSQIWSDWLGNTLEYFSRYGVQNISDSHWSKSSN